jgi:hypothetical protein
MEESSEKQALNTECLTKIGGKEYFITEVGTIAVFLIRRDTVFVLKSVSFKRHFISKHEGSYANLSLNGRQEALNLN